MHFDQLSESARDLINETFGEDEPIVFRPQGGKSYEIRGVFQSLYREVDPFGFEFFYRISPIQPRWPEIFVVPKVFTNSNSDPLSTQRNGMVRFSGFKIAIFVKNIVRGQKRLVDPMGDLTRFENGC